MTSAPTFTAGSVTALMPADGGGRATYFDRGQGAVRGLCVRVTGACHRSFWFRYEHDGAKRWIPLGDVGETSLKGARAAADALRARVGRARRGETSFPHEDDRNPRRADVEDAGALTFGKVAEAWLASDRFGALRAATRREYGRVVRKLLVPAFGSSAPNGIVRQDVADFLLDLRDGFDVREDTKPKDRRSPRFSRWDT